MKGEGSGESKVICKSNDTLDNLEELKLKVTSRERLEGE